MQEIAIYGCEPLHGMMCCMLQSFVTLVSEIPCWSGLQIGKGFGLYLMY